MEGGHLLIYKEVSGDSRAKEGVGCIINKNYKGYISKRIDGTEIILSVELKMEENVTIIVTYGPNEDEITCDKHDYWEKLDFTIQNAKDKLIIIGDLNARVGMRDEESSFVVGNQGEIVTNKNGRRLINFCILNELIIANTFYQDKDIHKYNREV